MSEKISKGQDVAFDVARQFLSIAMAGIGFGIGISGGTPEAYHQWQFWVAIICFGASVFCGFYFLQHCASLLSQDKELDIYDTTSRVCVLLQIVLLIVATSLLLRLHYSLAAPPQETAVIIENGQTGAKTKVLAPLGSSVQATILPDGTVKAEVK